MRRRRRGDVEFRGLEGEKGKGSRGWDVFGFLDLMYELSITWISNRWSY